MKKAGWESALYEYVAHSKDVVFTWGENDCCLWVARFVDKVCDTDYASLFDGKYNTAAGATALMQSKGFSSTEEVADAYFHSIPRAYAQRGDIVLHPQGALGICTGRKSFFLKEEGLTEIDTLECQKAWEI